MTAMMNHIGIRLLLLIPVIMFVRLNQSSRAGRSFSGLVSPGIENF
jgi:hypothetical protein